MAQISGTAMVNIATNDPTNIIGFDGGATEYGFSTIRRWQFYFNGVTQATDVFVSAADLANFYYVFGSSNETAFIGVADVLPFGEGSGGLIMPMVMSVADIPPPPPPPPGVANLIISSVSVISASVTAGGTDTLNYTVKNTGTANAFASNRSSVGPSIRRCPPRIR